MPIATVNGLGFHVQTLGTGGSPIVLVHGLLGTLANWYFGPAPTLARRHRVILYDLRGHGRSDSAPSGYGVRSMAEDLRHIAQRFAGGAATIVGHSYGGVVALRFALDCPSLVDRLVIVDAPLPITEATTHEVMLGEIGEPEGGDGNNELTPAVISEFVAGRLDNALSRLTESQQAALGNGSRRRRRIVERMLGHLDTTVLSDVMAEPDISDHELAACRCPVLLCYGTRTFPQMSAACERLARMLPHARVRTFDAAHQLPREQPVALAQAVLEFVDG